MRRSETHKKHFWVGIVNDPQPQIRTPEMLKVGDLWRWREGIMLFEVCAVEATDKGVEILSEVRGSWIEGEGPVHTREMWDTLVRNADWWEVVG